MGLQLRFLVVSLPSFVIRVMLVLNDEHGSASHGQFFWKDLRRIGTTLSLNVG